MSGGNYCLWCNPVLIGGMILGDSKCILWLELVSLNEVTVACRGLNVMFFVTQ